MSKNRLIIIILALALVIAADFWYFKIFLPQGEVIEPKDNTIETTSQPVNNEVVDTTNWNIEREEELGFEIKLPKGFSVDSQREILPGPVYYTLINDKYEVKPFLTVEPKKKNETVQDFIKSYELLNKIVSSSKIVTLPTGVVAAQYDYENTYIIEGVSNIYLFYDMNNVDYYQSIVNSFKFINSSH